MTKQKKRAVIYLRARCIGGSDDAVDAQLARQRAVCIRIAEQHGATVIREYEAIGGVRDSHVRYVVSVMLGQAAEAKADFVITSGFDRLCRGPAKADRELLHAIHETGAVLLGGSTWDVSAPTEPGDDALAELHQAILTGRPA
jgi:DNA invertase Pin-like site-specific DNA recombinase